MNPGKIVVMLSFKPTDSYSVYLPNISPTSVCVWVLRVDTFITYDDQYLVTGPMLYNASHNITEPFSVSDNSYTVLLNEDNIMGIYDDANFTEEDIASLEENVATVVVR